MDSVLLKWDGDVSTPHPSRQGWINVLSQQSYPRRKTSENSGNL